MVTFTERAKEFAIKAHRDVNHKYDGKDYSYHLYRCIAWAIKFSHLLPEHDKDSVFAAIWLHDTIEDCRLTYNDIKSEFGYYVAELVFAVTNEKGRERHDRANDKYYKGIREVENAYFIKMVDRLANVEYSAIEKGKMFKRYEAEQNNFIERLLFKVPEEMCVALRMLQKGEAVSA